MTPESALPLILMTLGAIAMPNLASFLRIPVAVAEIGYGILIGSTLLDLVHSDQFISFIADVGFAFFMFLAGLEIDFRGLSVEGIKRGLVALILSAISFAVVFAFGSVLHWPLWISLAAGATSVGLLVSVVREAGIGGSALGNTMLGQAAIGEGLTIIILSVLHVHHEAHGSVWGFSLGILRMLGLVGAVVVVLVALRTLLWWFPDPFLRLVAHDDPSEIGVRVGFGLMFAFVGLSMLSGVEPFLGAFIAGTMLTFVIREKGALEHKLASMAYGFFVPIFFIHVGIRLKLSLSLMLAHLGTIVMIVIVMLIAKLVPTLWYRRYGMSYRDIAATSSLLAAPLTLLIAIVDIGSRVLKPAEITPAMASIAITAGILASLIYPSLARQLLRHSATNDADAVPAQIA